MTYRELRNKISEMTEYQLDTDVTVYDAEDDEFFQVDELTDSVAPADVLDEGHPFLIIRQTEVAPL